MRPERLQAVGRVLAWSSPALLAAGVVVSVSLGLAGVGDGDMVISLFFALFYAAVIAGLAGVVVSVLAARRAGGRERRAAIRAAALAAVVPALYASIWLFGPTADFDTCGSTTATAGWSGPERGKRSESVEEALEPGRYLIRVSGFEGAADAVHRYGLKLDAR